MDIQIDTREKQRAIRKIVKTFDDHGVKYFSSKLLVGDYMSLDNPRLIIDRKQSLQELCGNVCQQHERFRAEIIRANEAGIKLVFLCEHGKGIEKLDDVLWWENPRAKKRVKKNGVWVEQEQKVMHGDVLYKILCTMQRKYGVEFLFCNKKDTGKQIMEILSNGQRDN